GAPALPSPSTAPAGSRSSSVASSATGSRGSEPHPSTGASSPLEASPRWLRWQTRTSTRGTTSSCSSGFRAEPPITEGTTDVDDRGGTDHEQAEARPPAG